MSKILLVEDDKMIAMGLVYVLKEENYDVIHSETIEAARAEIINTSFDMAILDMQLGDGTSYDILPLLKEKSVGIIFLSVIDDEGNIVRAFDLGADDYMTKPFRVRELLVRIKRILNQKNKLDKDILISGEVKINTKSGKVYLSDKLIELTALEYRLLITFLQNKGQILSRNQILESVWDSNGNFIEDNTLSVYIKRLREKLGKSCNIETVRGMGYRLC